MVTKEFVKIVIPPVENVMDLKQTNVLLVDKEHIGTTIDV